MKRSVWAGSGRDGTTDRNVIESIILNELLYIVGDQQSCFPLLKDIYPNASLRKHNKQRAGTTQ